MTGYPETIAPLVMDPLRLRCASSDNIDKMTSSIPECFNNKNGVSTKVHIMKHAHMLDDGLISHDTKSSYAEGQFCPRIMACNAKEYSNTETYSYNAYDGECVFAEPNAYTCNQSNSTPEQLRNTSAITNY